MRFCICIPFDHSLEITVDRFYTLGEGMLIMSRSLHRPQGKIYHLKRWILNLNWRVRYCHVCFFQLKLVSYFLSYLDKFWPTCFLFLRAVNKSEWAELDWYILRCRTTYWPIVSRNIVTLFSWSDISYIIIKVCILKFNLIELNITAEKRVSHSNLLILDNAVFT